jgi:hypothetical protein
MTATARKFSIYQDCSTCPRAPRRPSLDKEGKFHNRQRERHIDGSAQNASAGRVIKGSAPA